MPSAVWYYNASTGPQMKHRSAAQNWVRYDVAECAALEAALARNEAVLTLSGGKRRIDLKKQREEIIDAPDVWRATRRQISSTPLDHAGPGGAAATVPTPAHNISGEEVRMNTARHGPQ